MDNVKSSMPGMKTAIKNLSEAADAIESAASSAQSSSIALPTNTSKMFDLVCHDTFFTNGGCLLLRLDSCDISNFYRL